MPYRLISQQMLLEHEVVARVADALRTAIGWGHHAGAAQKLDSIRFLAESFQRHVERMLDLEEHGGYLELLGRSHPQLGSELDRLLREHDEFRRGIEHVLGEMQGFDASNPVELDTILDELTSLLARIDSHNKIEMSMLQEVVLHPAPQDEPDPG